MRHLAVVGRDTHSLLISWQPPATANGVILYYTATYQGRCRQIINNTIRYALESCQHITSSHNNNSFSSVSALNHNVPRSQYSPVRVARDTHQLHLQHLNQDTLYTISVVAVTKAGQGRDVAIDGFTLPPGRKTLHRLVIHLNHVCKFHFATKYKLSNTKAKLELDSTSVYRQMKKEMHLENVVY